MYKTISIKITDNKTGDVVLKEDYNDFGQFRLVFFKDGLLDIYGKLPWKAMKNPCKQWAQTWAETNAGEFEAMVRQYRPETTDEEFIDLLHDMENEAVNLFVAKSGKRDTAVASHIVRELLAAVTMTVRKVANEIRTIWESPQPIIEKTDSNGVLGWLFRKGGRDGYNN